MTEVELICIIAAVVAVGIGIIISQFEKDQKKEWEKQYMLRDEECGKMYTELENLRTRLQKHREDAANANKEASKLLEQNKNIEMAMKKMKNEIESLCKKVNDANDLIHEVDLTLAEFKGNSKVIKSAKEKLKKYTEELK